MYFPTFYTVKSLVERQPHPLEHAYDKWRNEIWDSCKALWTLWVPAQVINFAFVPRYLRVPFGMTPCRLFLLLLLCFMLCFLFSVSQSGCWFQAASGMCQSALGLCQAKSHLHTRVAGSFLFSFPLTVPFLLPSLRVFCLWRQDTVGM